MSFCGISISGYDDLVGIVVELDPTLFHKRRDPACQYPSGWILEI